MEFVSNFLLIFFHIYISGSTVSALLYENQYLLLVAFVGCKKYFWARFLRVRAVFSDDPVCYFETHQYFVKQLVY